MIVWREKAAELIAEVYAVNLAARDGRTPWYARVLAAAVAGYAFSPIDLIPDFIPVLGYLDDLILIPLGVALVLKLIPIQVMQECREKSRQTLQQKRPISLVTGAIILIVWIVLVALIVIRFAQMMHIGG
jgi:uncharacterized membrane protein YkvA (DUF1232 family)